MKPLPPTLREKRRYVLVKITNCNQPDCNITQKDLYYTIRDACIELFGDVGLSNMHIAVVWSENQYFIVKCKRGSEFQVISSISIINQIHNTPVSMHTVKISGTIHGTKKRIGISHN